MREVRSHGSTKECRNLEQSLPGQFTRGEDTNIGWPLKDWQERAVWKEKAAQAETGPWKAMWEITSNSVQ